MQSQKFDLFLFPSILKNTGCIKSKNYLLCLCAIVLNCLICLWRGAGQWKRIKKKSLRFKAQFGGNKGIWQDVPNTRELLQMSAAFKLPEHDKWKDVLPLICASVYCVRSVLKFIANVALLKIEFLYTIKTELVFLMYPFAVIHFSHGSQD